MTNTMWGGRFAASPAEVMEDINASIDFDKRLWRQDISASKAHVAMLARTSFGPAVVRGEQYRSRPKLFEDDYG